MEPAVPRAAVRRPGWRRAGLAVLVLLAGLAVWVSQASRPGSRVEGCFQGCQGGASGPAADSSLRVVSFNVLHGFPRFESLDARLAAIAAEIRSQGVDIICLQEVPWTARIGSGAALLARETGLNYAYLRANGNRRTILFEEGVAILSRYPLENVSFTTLEPRAGFFENRVALRATAATPWGDVDVVVAHLTHGDPEINRRQAAALQAWVRDRGDNPALVAGDLNATEDTAQIHAMARDWVDLGRAGNPEGPDLTCCVDDLGSGPGEVLEKRIDYLFWVPGGDARLGEVRVAPVLDQPFPWAGGWLWPSDHVGVLADLHIER